jgi:hypothetical protein
VVQSGRKEVKVTRNRKEKHVVLRTEKVAVWGKITTVVGGKVRRISADL